MNIDRLDAELLMARNAFIKAISIAAFTAILDAYLIEDWDGHDQINSAEDWWQLGWDAGLLELRVRTKAGRRDVGTIAFLIQGGSGPAEWFTDWSWKDTTEEGRAFDAFLDAVTRRLSDAEDGL